MYNIGDKGLRPLDRDAIKGDFADNKAVLPSSSDILLKPILLEVKPK